METPIRNLRKLNISNVEKLCTPLKIPASPFMTSLGYGTGVNVFRLERSPKCDGNIRSPLAIKRISKRSRTQENASLLNSRLQKEAEILRKLSHPNIVGFRGVTKALDGVDSLALECCKTSLGTILEERNEDKLGPLDPNSTIRMIRDITNALAYIHTEAKILHGDLKSYNILVKGNFDICKLCDFGVSLPIGDDGTIDFVKNPNLEYIGTDIWSAPEVIDKADVIDCKADIFSFGLIIYETIALIPPHTLNLTDESVSESDNVTEDESRESEENIDKTESFIESACGTRPPLPEAFELSNDYNIIVEIFYCCTNELPEDRPTAKAILESLQLLKNE